MTPPASPSALARVLRHHRIIWWILGVSLLLSWLSSLPARVAFGGILDHSQAADRLVHGFDLGTFGELMSSPELPMGALLAASAPQFFIYFVYLLFLAGGINRSYLSERRLETAAFFQACGAAFWRMVRLTLVSLLPFALLGGGLLGLTRLTKRLGESPSERLEFYALGAGLLVLGLAMLWIRAWFDLAQARTVAWEERGMFKTARRTFGLVTGKLYGAYLGIALVRLALVSGGLWLWTRLAPESTMKSFLLMEAFVLAHIVTRLWQRAASVRALEAMPRTLPTGILLPEPPEAVALNPQPLESEG